MPGASVRDVPYGSELHGDWVHGAILAILAACQPEDIENKLVLVPKHSLVYMQGMNGVSRPLPPWALQAMHELSLQHVHETTRFWANSLKSLLQRAAELQRKENSFMGMLMTLCKRSTPSGALRSFSSPVQQAPLLNILQNSSPRSIALHTAAQDLIIIYTDAFCRQGETSWRAKEFSHNVGFELTT